jgi:uncharacterized protein
MPPGKQGSPRFLADAMLGSIARKLRALGFETTYYREGEDEGLLALAFNEGRVVLTSDRSLAARAGAKGVSAILVGGNNDRARIRGIVRSARLAGTPLQAGDSLCSNCGGELQVIPRASALNMVPPSVGRTHRLFFRCSRCGQVYWRGSHWKKLTSLARLLREE